MKHKTGLEHKSIIWIKNTDRELKPIGETIQPGGKKRSKEPARGTENKEH